MALSLQTTPRTMKVSVAACAPGTPPDTGVSTNCGAACAPLGLQTPALRCTLHQGMGNINQGVWVVLLLRRMSYRQADMVTSLTQALHCSCH